MGLKVLKSKLSSRVFLENFVTAVKREGEFNEAPDQGCKEVLARALSRMKNHGRGSFILSSSRGWAFY